MPRWLVYAVRRITYLIPILTLEVRLETFKSTLPRLLIWFRKFDLHFQLSKYHNSNIAQLVNSFLLPGSYG